MLEYAPKRRRRWKRRLLVTLAILGALGLATYRLGPAGYRKARALVVQRLARFEQPADGTLLYDSGTRFSLENRRALQTLGDAQGPSYWARSPGAVLTVFCGNVTVGDDTYLCMVEATPAEDLGVHVSLLRPAGIKRPAKVALDTGSSFDTGKLAGLSSWARQAARGGRLRVFAGHLEPGEYPRVTFRYELEGRPGECGVRLSPKLDATLDVLPPR